MNASLRSTRALVLMLSVSTSFACAQGAPPSPPSGAQEWPQHSMDRPRPPRVNSAGAVTTPPPADAVVLFDGRSLDRWTSDDKAPAWRVVDGAFEVVPGTGTLRTRDAFGDVQLHIEWMAPAPPRGSGQDRGNSGVFLMTKYEVQVLDSWENDTYPDGQAAALYGVFPPMVNASRPPGEWQSYDIVFRRPRWDASGKLLSQAMFTVIHNGVLVHDAAALPWPTANQRKPPYEQHEDRLPLSLQDHGHAVRFRNVWVRDLERR